LRSDRDSKAPFQGRDVEHADVVVIGGGTAGKYVGLTMAKAGLRTAVVERKLIGGACPNVACLPSKNIIHCAKVAQLSRRAAEFGMSPGLAPVDMIAVRDRKRRMVQGRVAVNLSR
jgi:pyruvate/2-oxoglutarate dehydrogenase complex dihydrolipoamide dehydrogenase (E3) component